MRNDLLPLPWSRVWLAASLALVAGYVDAFSLLKFDVFSSFMSGNTTESGLQLGLRQLSVAGYRLLPIPCFVIGVACGTLLLELLSGEKVRRPCAAIAGLLAAYGGLTIAAEPPAWLSVIWLSFTMGMMNTVITQIGRQSINIAFVSGDLTALGRHLALAVRQVPLPDAESPSDTRWRRSGVLAAVWLSLLCGAMLGGAGSLLFPDWILLPPLAILAVVVGWPRFPGSRE